MKNCVICLMESFTSPSSFLYCTNVTNIIQPFQFCISDSASSFSFLCMFKRKRKKRFTKCTVLYKDWTRKWKWNENAAFMRFWMNEKYLSGLFHSVAVQKLKSLYQFYFILFYVWKKGLAFVWWGKFGGYVKLYEMCCIGV